ncbi:MAG: hypothetical protein Q8K72_20635, partial [Acidimicrobiales bacterium]|nr:hypothetical protein [Acidimicrobiales bacterium]
MALREVEGDAGLDLGDVLGPSSDIATRGRLSGWRRIAVGMILPAALVALWSVLSATGVLSERLLPAPVDVLKSGRDFFVAPKRAAVPGVVPFRGAAIEHVRASVGRWAIGYTIALCVGLPLGLELGLSRRTSATVDPVFQALRS